MAIIAVTLMFAVNGAVIGGYAASLPSLRDKLDFDATQIAIILFCAGAAAILAMQIGGRLADAIGAREITLAAMPFLIAGMITDRAGSGLRCSDRRGSPPRTRERRHGRGHERDRRPSGDGAADGRS